MKSSPAQRLLGRRTRTTLPTGDNLLKERYQAQAQDLIDLRQKQEKY